MRKLFASGAALALAAGMVATPAQAFTFAVTYNDAAGVGFNDNTARAPVGGNSGTTLGQQRRNALEYALARWGERLQSSVQVRVTADWIGFTSGDCNNFSGTLGQAGPTLHTVGAGQANTLYPDALANALFGNGSDLFPGNADITAHFNPFIDSSNTCLGGAGFYYGLDNDFGAQFNFVATAMHELGHGLGFVSTTDPVTGDPVHPNNQPNTDLFAIFDRFVFDSTTTLFWPAMTDAQRAASATNSPNLVFNGTNSNAGSAFLSAGRTSGRARLYAPSPAQDGSSVSHWDVAATPNLLMEPNATDDKDATATLFVDLTTCAFADLGWTLSAPFSCPDIAGNAPSISAIADQSINVNASTGALPFTLTDADTALNSLTLSRSSSNTTLVPVANIVFGGSGGSRTVTVTPASGQSGSATITLTVSDGTFSDQEIFVVTVTAANTAPTIQTDIADQSIDEDGSTGSLSFAIDDAETAESSLTVTRASSNTTLVPLGNVVLGGSGANRTVTVTPAANRSGTATITITVSDGSLSDTETFAVNVASVNDAPTLNAISNRSIAENASQQTITLSGISAGPSESQTLAVTATSNNTALIPNPTVIYSSASSSGSIRFTPVPDESGSATVTVTVTDNGDTANGGVNTFSRTFDVTVNAAANTAPTSTQIANQSIAQNASTGALAFTVGDAETAAGSLAVSGTSSNTTLVPNANIVFGGSGANRTVSVSPAANQSGSTTITYRVSDGTVTTSKTFTLAVASSGGGNTPPTVTQIGDQDIDEDGTTGALAFTVGDAQSAVSALEISATSNNTDLVPDASIVLGGSGGGRTIAVTPAADQFGSATITYAVSDGEDTTTRQFTIVVDSVNDAPTLGSIANQTVNANASTGALSFSVSDPETSAGSLSVSGTSSNGTLIPNANIVFGGSGGNRTVTVTPTSGQSGNATITYLVGDGSLTATKTFVVTVNAAPPSGGGDEGGGEGGGGGGSLGLFSVAVLASFALLAAARRQRQRMKSAQTAVSR
jgi:hypothetical protein